MAILLTDNMSGSFSMSPIKGSGTELKNNFSKVLRDALRKIYGKLPSASVLAGEFNLRAYDTTPITQETARRWIRGISMPEDTRTKVLADWLKLDMNNIYSQKFTSAPSFQIQPEWEMLSEQDQKIIISIAHLLIGNYQQQSFKKII